MYAPNREIHSLNPFPGPPSFSSIYSTEKVIFHLRMGEPAGNVHTYLSGLHPCFHMQYEALVICCAQETSQATHK